MTGLRRGIILESFSQLEQGLKGWRSFVDQDVYDAGGMKALLCACIENLRNHALPAEVEDLRETLSDEDRSFLKSLIDEH
jgi:hypothetical protein